MSMRFSPIFLGILFIFSGSTSSVALSNDAFNPSAKPAETKTDTAKSSAMATASQDIPQKAGITKTVSMAGMTEYHLANGLTVVLVPDLSKPTTTVNITYKVGSRNENYGETGMAHLLEHLMFKGTPLISHLPQELSSRGMRPNGTTWYDRTNYYETFAASDAKLEWALKMEADRMVNAFIAKKDLDSEMTVVRNEMESGENDSQRILIQKMSAIAYQWHNYGKETIGARSDVENVNIAHLQAFYRQYYQPDNAVLVVAGAFDTPKVLTWIKTYFGAIERPTRQLPITYTVEPPQDGERSIRLRRVGSEQTIAALYHIPASTHPDFPALQVLINILSDSPSGRLYKNLVETQMAADVSGYAYPLKEPGFLILSADLREKSSLEKAQKTFIRTIEDTTEHTFNAKDVARAKLALNNGWNQVLRDPQKLGIALSQAIAVGDWRVFFLNHERLEHVTPQDVQRVANTYLKSANRTLGEFIPTRTPERVVIPQATPIETQLADFKPSTTISQGEVFDPSYSNIEKRVIRFHLANGAQIAILAKKNRGDTVSLYGQLHWGDSTSLKGDHWQGELLASMLMRGTQRLSHKELADELEKLDAQLAMNSDIDGLTISANTTQSNLPGLINLIAEILKTPRFDTKEWAVLKQQTLADLESAQTDPSSWASRQLQRYHQPYTLNDPFYTSTLETDIDAVKHLDLKAIKNFYKTMVSTEHSEWAIVGSTDSDSIKPRLNAAIGNIHTKTPYTRLKPIVFTPPADVLIKQLNEKANAILAGRYLISMKDTDPDYPALVAANTLLGGGFLNSRLAMRIRQKEGISYGIGSYLQTSSDDPYTEWHIYALFAPQNRERLIKALNEELAGMQKDPVDPALLQQGIQGWIEGRRLGRSQDIRLAADLAEWMRIGRTGYDFQKLEDKVKALKPAEVEAAIHKYLHPHAWVFSLAGTFPATENTASKK